MSFDWLARHYRWLEAVLAGGVLQRCRTAFIEKTRDAGSVLLLGEGNGRFLPVLLEGNETARVVCVEQSGPMIRRARRALEREGIDPGRVEFVQADVMDWVAPAEEFDLIVSHFFLDCFTEAQLQFLVPRLARAGRPECCWLLADFQVPERGISRLRAQVIHRLMYVSFRLATDLPAKRLAPPDPFLHDAGFRLTDRMTAEWGLLRSDCWVRKRKKVEGEKA